MQVFPRNTQKPKEMPSVVVAGGFDTIQAAETCVEPQQEVSKAGQAVGRPFSFGITKNVFKTSTN